MKKSTFSPAQIAGILKEFDNSKSAEDINREHGVVKPVYINGGSAIAAELKRIKEKEISKPDSHRVYRL